MKLKNVLAAFLIIALVMMPTVLAATGEDGVTIIKKDGSDSNIEKVGSSKDDSEDHKIESDGFNRLLMAPVTGVDYILGMDPLEKAVLLLVGTVIGGSVIITIISFAINNGRIGIGSISGKYQTMLQGRNWMIFVFLGFLGFLLALALLKYVGTTSIF